MLSKADNERLTRVGLGTPMGEMLPEFWTPALRSAHLEAEGAPKRVRLLGQNFVDGRVGFSQGNCPPRGVSLALAPNEENGLRCILYGWKFSIEGICADTQTEPADRRREFCKRVPPQHYAAREASPPPFFDFELRCTIVHGSWLQGFEGS
jgi:phthalate 4,5-dioxygenase